MIYKNNIVLMNKKVITFLILGLLVFSACGKKTKIHSGTAQELYSDATNELYNNKGGFPWVFTGPDYDLILETLREIQLRYTFSPFATLAEIRTADTYFRQEEYIQAITEYDNFIKNHPGHNEVEYAMYQLALSNYKLKGSKDRDPTYAREAVKWFTIFKENYPNSELYPGADKRILKCNDILAEREIFIGKYYMRKKNYKAAEARFNLVLQNFPETKYTEEAYKLISKLPAEKAPES